jgi:hypothetical protein
MPPVTCALPSVRETAKLVVSLLVERSLLMVKYSFTFPIQDAFIHFGSGIFLKAPPFLGPHGEIRFARIPKPESVMDGIK